VSNLFRILSFKNEREEKVLSSSTDPSTCTTAISASLKYSGKHLLKVEWEKLVRERGAGSREQGFHLQFFWNFDDHGKADLLPWIINVWTFIKYWR
jgi:hypothetical protein